MLIIFYLLYSFHETNMYRSCVYVYIYRIFIYGSLRDKHHHKRINKYEKLKNVSLQPNNSTYSLTHMN